MKWTLSVTVFAALVAVALTQQQTQQLTEQQQAQLQQQRAQQQRALQQRRTQQQQQQQQQNNAPRRQQQSVVEVPDASADELEFIFANKERATRFVKCVMEPATCEDKRAHLVNRLAPILFQRRGRCREIRGLRCTANDEKNIRFVIQTLQSKYPDLYSMLLRDLLESSG